MLAHREHEVARLLLRLLGIERAAKDLFRMRDPKKEAHGGRNGRIGAFRKHARHGHDRPDPAEIGESRQQRHLRLIDAERALRGGSYPAAGRMLRSSASVSLEKCASGGSRIMRANRARSRLASVVRYGEPSNTSLAAELRLCAIVQDLRESRTAACCASAFNVGRSARRPDRPAAKPALRRCAQRGLMLTG